MPADLQKARELFLHAVGKLPPDEWDTYVAKACGGDAELAELVRRFLQIHRDAGSFLEAPALGPTIDVPIAESLGTMIGPYKLLEQIGEGGFGVVFMAEQTEPVRRKVALKILKAGMDTRQVVARFEAERQALAIMDHPNIAKVFDGGSTPSCRPFFVMELVKGMPITEFCDQNHLTPRQRLELFIPVCQAVQHAHQKGIIHRDLKPSNVLVSRHDSTPVPKIIDFGIAKALGQELTDKTLFTAIAHMVGTPLYMSPEQAGMSDLDIDTRSDIYSLGVLLYELLTGTTPFDRDRFKKAAYDEIRRIIREEEPPKPSTRLSSLSGRLAPREDSKEGTLTTSSLASVAAQRHTEPAKLTKLVRGELDWIVMKALEKDRNRRYETANGFAMDVQRYLADEPVQACPPSAMYRFRKFARRNKAALVTAAVVVAALLAGTALAAWQATRATSAMATAVNEKHRADDQAAIATSITAYLQQMLGSVSPSSKGHDYTVRQLLDDYAADLEKQLPNHPEVEATLQATIGKGYAALGERGKARKHLARALALRRSVFGDQHEKYADSLVDYACPGVDPSERPEREADLRQALATYRARGVGGKPVIYALWTLKCNIVAQAWDGVPGKWDEIEPVWKEAVAEARKSPGVEFPEIPSIQRGLVQAKIVQSQYAEAEKLARETLAMQLRLNGPEHLETAWGYYVLGEALRYQHKFAEGIQAEKQALTIMRRALPPEHASIARALTALIRTLDRADKSHALAVLFPSPAELGQLESVFREVLRTTKPSKFNNDDPVLVAVCGLAQFSEFYLHLGNEFAAAGRAKEAEESRQKVNLALESLQSEVAGNPDLLPYAHGYSAVALMKAGQPERAKELCRKLLDQGMPMRAGLYNNVAWLLATAEVPAHRDPDLAIDLAKKAVESNPQSRSYRNTLGVARYRAGDWKQAISDLEQSVSLGKGGNSHDWYFLAMAHWRLGEKEKARVWYDRAVSDKGHLVNEELRRFRSEAAELLGVEKKKN
jgi:eukaryotic-like serine/threonine-protein kinase